MPPLRRDYTDGGACPSCLIHGTLWWTPGPERYPIRLCDEHSLIVADAPGWEEDAGLAFEAGGNIGEHDCFL